LKTVWLRVKNLGVLQRADATPLGLQRAEEAECRP
jgi:hypothetical protein